MMGTDTEPFAYDNERPAHVVDVAPFLLDTVPVTNGQYLAFVEAGGYDEPRFWSKAGWRHRLRGGSGGAPVLVAATAPGRGRCGATASRWTCRSTSPSSTSAGTRPTPTPASPASASPPRRSGRRPRPAPRPPPPTWASATSARRRSGAYPDGASRYGAEQMLGDVWEWTSSDFTAYPGFATFPYKEYSEVFYGSDYKVLRGGSWATSPLVARSDVPQLGLPDPPPDLRRLPVRPRCLIVRV